MQTRAGVEHDVAAGADAHGECGCQTELADGMVEDALTQERDAVDADEWTDFAPIASTNTTRTLTGDDFRRGIVMYRIGTDEQFDFSAPPGATMCADWEAFASEWYRCFEEDEDVGDDRQLLTWGGRFADVADCAVNFYSTGDHVLELEDNNNVWATDRYENWDQMFERYSWHKQEMWKGRRGMLPELAPQTGRDGASARISWGITQSSRRTRG